MSGAASKLERGRLKLGSVVEKRADRSLGLEHGNRVLGISFPLKYAIHENENARKIYHNTGYCCFEFELLCARKKSSQYS